MSVEIARGGLTRRISVAVLPGERAHNGPVPAAPPVPRRLADALQWVAYICGLSGVFALLSLSVPPRRWLDVVALICLGGVSVGVSGVLWLRASSGRMVQTVPLALGCLGLAAATVYLASNPPSGAGLVVHLRRTEWLLILAVLVLPAVAIRRLVTELRRRVEELSRLSLTDQLTGCSNRRAWDEELRRELARSRRDRTVPCVAILDLDRFKAFNDMRGHVEGDGLLQRTAAEWRTALRESDVLARYGGEEFAVLLRDCRLEDALLIVERLRARVTDEQTVSAGVARWDGVETHESLVERADRALYAAKLAGRDRVKVAENSSAETASRRLDDWTGTITRLLDERSVVAAFQPIVDLRTGEVRAYEALARPNPQKVEMSVEAMFSTAQRLGLGRDLDWLCRRAALAGAHWIPAGVPLFINCSLSGLVDPVHRVDQMLLVLRSVGRAPADVVLEITERELVGDLGRLRSVVDTYRREGFRFAVDDVGEGHSTLEVLAATAPEFVKVARSLVVAVSSRGSRAAIRALVAFAQETDAQVVAEGIETANLAESMGRMGVGLGQGWHLGRPAFGPQAAAELTASPRVSAAVTGARPPQPGGAAAGDALGWLTT